MAQRSSDSPKEAPGHWNYDAHPSAASVEGGMGGGERGWASREGHPLAIWKHCRGGGAKKATQRGTLARGAAECCSRGSR
eukprot:5987817-Pyramimonas_sp.AAC.1